MLRRAFLFSAVVAGPFGCGGSVASTAHDAGDDGRANREGGAGIAPDAASPSEAGAAGPTVLVQACTPKGIAVDAQNIYWADDGGGTHCSLHAGIWRADLDGTHVTSLVGDGSPGPGQPWTISSPFDVVLYGDRVYWDNGGEAHPQNVVPVAACSKMGCTVGDGMAFDPGAFFASTGLAVSDAGVFWAGGAQPPYGFGVWRIALDDAGSSGALVEGLYLTGTVAVDDTQVFFGAAQRVYRAVSVGTVGATAAPLAPDGGASSFAVLAPLPYADGGSAPLELPSFAVDDTTLYFTNGAGGTVGSLPKSGGTPTVFVSDCDSPMRVAVDEANIYWTAYGTLAASPSDSSVMKCAKSGCGASGPTVLAKGLAGLSGFLAVDASYVYVTVTGDGTIRRMTK